MAIKAKDKMFRDQQVEITEWTCHYCPEVATTIRQGAPVCLFHVSSWH